MILQRCRESDGLGDVVVRSDGIGTLYFEVGGVPELRFVVEADKGRVRGARAEDSHPCEFLIKRPDKFVHVNVGVSRRRRESERGAGDGALFVDHCLEARHVRRVRGADGAAFVSRDEALQLESHETGYVVGLITSDETSHGFRGYCAGAEVVIVFVEIVAASVRGVGLPVVSRPTIASIAIEGQEREARR